MSEKVVTLFPIAQPVDPKDVLDAAINCNFEDVVIIGRTGGDMIISTSHENFSNILWELKQAERVVLRE